MAKAIIHVEVDTRNMGDTYYALHQLKGVRPLGHDFPDAVNMKMLSAPDKSPPKPTTESIAFYEKAIVKILAKQPVKTNIKLHKLLKEHGVTVPNHLLYPTVDKLMEDNILKRVADKRGIYQRMEKK